MPGSAHIAPGGEHQLSTTPTLYTLHPTAHTTPYTPTAAASPGEIVQQARQLYQIGDFEAAARTWQQAADAFANLGDRLNQAMALSNLSLSYQQLGQWDEAAGAIGQSLDVLQSLDKTEDQLRVLAESLEIQGFVQRSKGASLEALETWRQAEEIYVQMANRPDRFNSSDLIRENAIQKKIAKNQIRQARALQDLGLYRRACKTLLGALELDNRTCQVSEPELFAFREGSELLQIEGLVALGDVLRVTGKLEPAYDILSVTLKEAREIGYPKIASIYLSLGSAERARGNEKIALDFYKTAASKAISPTRRLQAQLNQLSLLLEDKNWSLAESLWRDIAPALDNLPASRAGIYAQINFAGSLVKNVELRANINLDNAKQNINSLLSILDSADRVLDRAVSQAKMLGDTRAGAYSLSARGRLYELRQEWQTAQQFTEEALNLAPVYKEPDIAYQLLWQLGRIRKAQGNRQGAIVDYTEAVKTLQSLRSDLVAASSEAQFSFRESVEPVYRELVGLLLPAEGEATQAELREARKSIEFLQVAELDNFFQDACADVRPAQIDAVDPKAAVFYTIILPERLEVIAALPGQPLRRYGTALPQEEVEATVKELQQAVTVRRFILDIKRFFKPSQKVYDWLVRPVEAELAESGVKTLVFVLDGKLRSIPVSALYDGKQYLIEKYGVAVTPGLQLLDPKPLPRQELKAIAAGLTQARQGFSPLPNVGLELNRIEAEVESEVLLDGSFTESNFQNIVESFPFPVVHVATHGEFSSSAEDTFILTWDDRINATELSNVLRRDTRETIPIELLVLSACRTAVGDKRAALGLAGVAVRAGARSTLASLWYVSDEATAILMERFYQELANSSVTKAEALRRAQEAILQDRRLSHPYYWSAFMLVGNWL
ncbi:MAG: CHAT domain-containing protein [Oscillatoria sp. SIO1A7]|nr:CHAT domain-containing protein [Oscillatoria sp. SIO1A7]